MRNRQLSTSRPVRHRAGKPIHIYIYFLNRAYPQIVLQKIDKINFEITKELNGDKYEIFNDREVGLKKAISKMKRDDTLVVLGKGREDYQDVEGKKVEYSDIEIIKKYL